MRTLISAVLRSMLVDVGAVIQRDLDAQKRVDLFGMRCASCGGRGIVVDLANRWYVGDEMVYGAKVCPECGGGR